MIFLNGPAVPLGTGDRGFLCFRGWERAEIY